MLRSFFSDIRLRQVISALRQVISAYRQVSVETSLTLGFFESNVENDRLREETGSEGVTQTA